MRYVKDIWFDIHGSSTAKAIDKPSRSIGNQNPGQYGSNPFRRQNNSYPVGAGNQLNAGNDGYGYGYGSNEGIGYSRAPGLYNDNPNPRQRPWLPWDQYVNSQYNTNRRQNIYQTPPPPTTEVQQRQLPGGRQQLQITSGASENQSPGEIRNGRQTDGQGQPNRQAGQNAYGGRRFNNRNPFNRNDRQPAQTRAYHNSTVHKYEAADVPVYASTAETQGNEIPYNDHEDFRRYEESFYSNTDWSGQYTEPETHMQYEDTKDLAEECVETHFCKASKSVIRYRNCQAVFQSNNQLHRHLKNCQGAKSTAATKVSSIAEEDQGLKAARVIKSSASDVVVDGYGFRGYRYATAFAALSPTGDKYKLYLDSGCTISLIDKKFILNHGIPVRKIPTPMNIRGIGDRRHNASEYIKISLFFFAQEGIAEIHRELYVVEDLTAVALIGIDILSPERIVLDFDKDVTRFNAYEELQIPIGVHTYRVQTRRTVYSKSTIRVPPHSRAIVPVEGPRHQNLRLPLNRDLLFEPQAHTVLSVFTHVVDETIDSVFVQNDTNEAITLSKVYKLGQVHKFEEAGYFIIDKIYNKLASKPPKRQPRGMRNVVKTVLATTAAFTTALSSDSYKTILPTGITIYGTSQSLSTSAITAVADAFPNL